jgi:formylglycine-generating enzyme required for sulfatase activity
MSPTDETRVTPAPNPAGATPEPVPSPAADLSRTVVSPSGHEPASAGTVPDSAAALETGSSGTVVAPLGQHARLAAAGAPGATGATPPGAVPGFEIDRELGRGGMGVVYQATQVGLGRTVALKMLVAGPYADPGLRARFLLEAESVAALEHPHIVRVYAFGEAGGHPYLAMEFVSGGSLSDRLRAAGPLPARAAAELLAALAGAVAHAHSRGVVHRDIKPANVLLTAEGELRLADFGLAKVGHSDLSVTGQVLGTPAYMAPEQAAGRIHDVGTGADVYALGAVLYDLLTGRPPFHGDSAALTLQKVMTVEPIRPRTLRPGVPRDLETICLKCLEKSPAKRYATADLLAADLGAFLAGRPISARPAGAAERAWKWVKRNPGRASAVAAVVLVALGGLGADAEVRAQRAADRRAADEAARQRQRETQAGDLVAALATADTAVVPQLVGELNTYGDLAAPRLRDLAEAPVTEKPGLHARLALLGAEPARARELAGYLPDCRAEELLTIRHFLTPHAAAVAPALWAVLADAKAESGARVRAACALAGLDPAAGRWTDAAAAVADLVVAENALQAAVWEKALEPVRGALVARLLDRYRSARERIRGGKLDESALVAEASAFELTATLLARYTTDRPAELAELAVTADARHYARFAPALRANKGAVVPLLAAELAKVEAPDWKDAPLKAEWAAVDAATARAVESAQGLVYERFAFVQAAPLDGFDALADRLGRSGYRPVRVRPYAAASGMAVAAAWARDGLAWKLASGLTADGLRARAAELRAAGFEPADVAAWVDPAVAPRPVGAFVAAAGGPVGAAVPPPLRFAAVWKPAPVVGSVRRLSLALPQELMYPQIDVMRDADLGPVVLHAVTVPGERHPRYSGVWGRKSEIWDMGWWGTKGDYLLARAGKTAADVSLVLDPDGDPKYAGVWHGALVMDAVQPTAVSTAEQLVKARELAAAGWRLVALSVADEKLTGSIWHRPQVTDAMLAAAGRRRGYAAAALVALGEAGAVWSAFRFPADGDPTARSHLSVRLAGIGADPLGLVRRFELETDVSAKRALVVALGDFPPEAIPAADRDALAGRLLEQYRAHPDPGLHSAIDWLLRRKWDRGARLAAVEAELATAARARVLGRALADVGPAGPLLPAPAVAEHRDWYVNGEGQTFAVVRGPVEFTMGSPPPEPGRVPLSEPSHRKRIPRTFAVATKEVTVAEFLRFRPDHLWQKARSPGPDTPAVEMAWYGAAEYCNWLSAREGIPPDQWCYEPNRFGRFDEGMRARPNHLKLTGYRLPSEAEWEYACRAGAVTARPYGRGEELLPRYAWYFQSAEERAWPVGLLRPNELGLFDALGNALEMVGDASLGYYTDRTDDLDYGPPQPVGLQSPRATRGGAYLYLPVSLRSAARIPYRPGDRLFMVGFRPARTLP